MLFMKVNKKERRQLMLPVLAVTAIVIVLFFGLRPKDWDISNNIKWLPNEKGLRFENPGIAYVNDLHLFSSKEDAGEFSIQMSVAPESLRKLGFRPILMLHGGEDLHQLAVWHWGASLIVMNGDDYDYSRKLPRITALDALVPSEASFITVTSSNSGTRLFINGTLVNENKNWKIAIPKAGEKLRLILGNSVYGKHGWQGEIYGLAFYAKALSPEKVQKQYEKWLRQKDFVAEVKDELLLLYSFNEFDGHLIPDQTGRNQPLQVPSRPIMLKKTILSSPYHNFNPTQSFFIDATLNLIGFMPLGALLYCWLGKRLSLPGVYRGAVIVVFCFFLSLSMEIVQVWLPYRASSLSDLVLNTLGAGFGVLLVDLMQRAWKGRAFM